MSEFLELKSLILEMKNTVSLLLPKCVPLSYVCDVSGKSRQTITAYVKSNLEPQVEFWLENGCKFTPLGFETSRRRTRAYGARVCKFTPLGFETCKL